MYRYRFSGFLSRKTRVTLLYNRKTLRKTDYFGRFYSQVTFRMKRDPKRKCAEYPTV